MEQKGPTMDPSMQAFINKHGGMAIGGMKFKKPEMVKKKKNIIRINILYI